jgi:FkbM family methyltransferase
VEPVDVVMDLGANTGLASIFFAQQFPRARVIAVEPDPDNFRLLQRNAAGRPRILPIQAAAWAEDTTLYLQKHDASGNSMGAWGVRTIVAPTNEAHAVEALSIATLMRRAGVASIDILKVDIEGAEMELFSHNVEEWLSGTRCVIIETHNRFRPGSDQRVSERLAADFQELQRMGENRVFLRRSAG